MDEVASQEHEHNSDGLLCHIGNFTIFHCYVAINVLYLPHPVVISGIIAIKRKLEDNPPCEQLF